MTRGSEQLAQNQVALPENSGRALQRGDLAHDTATGRTGVIVALPEDVGASVCHLRPEGGGHDWAARPADLVLGAKPEPPEVGAVVMTVYGRQRIMDVLKLPDEQQPMVYLRPEHGGTEWTVPVADLGKVVRP